MNARASLVAVGSMFSALACVGTFGDGAEGARRSGPAPATSPSATATPVFQNGTGMRLLTQREYTNTIRDLFGEDLEIPKLSHDSSIDGWTTVGASGASLTEVPTQDLETAALAIAEQVVASSRRATTVGCDPSGTPGDSCARGFVEKWGRRLFRRPLASSEVDRYANLAPTASNELDSPWDGLVMALAGLLESPSFLYRAEAVESVPDPAANGASRYTSATMAERLSFLAWGSTPDDELLGAADRGELVTDDGLVKAADRLFASPRADRGVLAFMHEWIDLEAIANATKDGSAFPEMTHAVRDAMKEQVERTVRDLIWDRSASFLDLFDTREIMMSADLAPFYGLSAPSISGWSKVRVDGEPRAGILGWAGVLSAHARPTRTSPTLRGLFVRQRVLCQRIGSPPPKVQDMQPTKKPTGEPLTIREQAEARLSNPSCAGCHRQMDPIGLGLESFDAVGRYRTEEQSMPIDSSGDVDGVAFTSLPDLAKLLREHPATGPCAARNVFRFAFGHMETADEEPIVRDLGTTFGSSGHHVKAFFANIARSDAFRRPTASTGEKR